MVSKSFKFLDHVNSKDTRYISLGVKSIYSSQIDRFHKSAFWVKSKSIPESYHKKNGLVIPMICRRFKDSIFNLGASTVTNVVCCF